MCTDHGCFLLYNLYAPAITSDDPAAAAARLAFKLRFYAALQRRWDGLLRGGRAVLVVGDFNIAPWPLDCPDPGPHFWGADRPDRLWLRGLLWHFEPDYQRRGPRKEQRDDDDDDEDDDDDDDGGQQRGAGEERLPPFVDCFRWAHRARRDAYTVWSTATGARANNYGTRIDLCLAAGLAVGPPGGGDSSSEGGRGGRRDGAPWVCASDIQPEVQGSDHCPVYVDVRHRGPFPCAAAPPPQAQRFAYSGTQTKLLGWLSRQAVGGGAGPPGETAQRPLEDAGAAASAAAATAASVSAPSVGASAAAAGSMLPPPPPPAQQQGRSGGGGKQGSLNGFFQPKPRSAAPLAAPTEPIAAEAAAPAGPPAAPAPAPPPASPSAFVQAELAAAAASRQGDTATAKAAWQRIQQRMAIPRCAHGEPAALKRVGKAGPNQGRYFYACARAAGKGPQAQCSFFKWVEPKAGEGAAKKARLQ
jgi:AP endonuclease-2